MEKVRDQIEAIEKRLHEIVRNRKNLVAPAIGSMQNQWWKKFTGARKLMVKSMNKQIEDPEQIPKQITTEKQCYCRRRRTWIMRKTINL